jgi:hypothetical protein
VFWSFGELCCWVHKLLASSPKADRSNIKGLMVPNIAGVCVCVCVLSMSLITLPYKTICINKHNDWCHMENFEMAKKRVIRTMSCVLLLGMC